MATYRVLVFGSTGTGKTSLCNSLTGQKMPVNSSARGVTFKSHTFDSIEFGKNNLIITDTIGLNESDGGTIPAASAATELLQLLNNSKEGYNLLVHVMKAPRITKTHKDNYKLFYERIVQKDIPVILVATGCENDNPMSKWAEENTEHFEKDGFEYREVLATCFIEGGRFESNYAPLRAESKNLVLDAIARYALPSPKKIYFDESTQHGLVELVSEDPLFKLERLYLIDKGIIYSLTIKTKRGQVAAEHFRNKIIKESSYKNSTPDSAIAIYAQYKNIPYEHRVDKQGMSYLYAAWSHDLLNKEFDRVIILFLEKGQSNLKYLKPFYEYAYKRFGTNLSSDNELLMEDADQKLKRKMKDELESEVKKEEHISGPKFDEVTTDSNEKIKMNLQKAKENKTNSDESARMLLQE